MNPLAPPVPRYELKHMYICTYTCVYNTYTYKTTHTHRYTYIYIYLHIYIHIFIYIYTHGLTLHIYIYIYIYMCVCLSVSICPLSEPYIYLWTPCFPSQERHPTTCPTGAVRSPVCSSRPLSLRHYKTPSGRARRRYKKMLAGWLLRYLDIHKFIYTCIYIYMYTH